MEGSAATAATKYRRAAARINYVAQDRPDIAVAANQLARSMAVPREGDEKGIKRLIRYLAGSPRCVYVYRYQTEPTVIDVMSDSDWAGCRATRRSTSGGAVLHGSHLLLHWSKMQSNVALSSGEAELSAQVKGVSEGLCVRNVAKDLGVELRLRTHADSSAARGILNRVGVGKLKHLEVKHLWVQDLVKTKQVESVKVSRLSNPSDILTHPCSVQDMRAHLRNLCMSVRPALVIGAVEYNSD